MPTNYCISISGDVCYSRLKCFFLNLILSDYVESLRSSMAVLFCGSFSFVLLCFHARLFVDALWSPARKGLAYWLSFVMSNYDVVTFPLVSWARCGA